MIFAMIFARCGLVARIKPCEALRIVRKFSGLRGTNGKTVRPLTNATASRAMLCPASTCSPSMQGSARAMGRVVPCMAS